MPGDGDCLYTAFIGAVRAAGGNCDVITPMLNGGRDVRRALEVPGTDLSVETEFADGGIFHIRQQGKLHREQLRQEEIQQQQLKRKAQENFIAMNVIILNKLCM